MFNLNYVLPSAMFLVVVLGFYFFKPKLPIRAYKTYEAILIIQAFVIVTDIVSSHADNTFERWPLWFLYLLNCLYYVGFLGRCYLFYGFSVALTKIRGKEHPARIIAMAAPAVLSVLAAITTHWTGWFFSFGPEGFVRGPLNRMTYICLVFYVLVSLFVITTHKEAFDNPHTFRAGVNYNIIILVGAVFRWLFPQHLLMDTFCVIAVLVMYLSYVNPEIHLEPRMRIFNREALKNYLDEISGRSKYKILALGIYDYYGMRMIYGGKQTDEGLGLIAAMIRETYPEVTCFYIQSGRFVLVAEKHIDLDRIYRELKARFKKPWRSEKTELYFEAVYCIIEPGDSYRTPDLIFSALTETLEKASPYEEDCTRITEGTFQAAKKEASYKQALEYAVDNNLVEVFLQPVFRDGEKKPVGAEALARIRDEKGNIVAPGYFISIAEKNGMINRLGEQVFEKVCMFVREHDVQSWGLEWINVNLSPLQFMKPDLAERYNIIASDNHVDPALLHLEITEEAMSNETFLTNHIKVLEDKGFRFVLDDYGIGYSNISRLKKCPFINVKLDMSLVWDYCKNPDDILPTMITAFKHMGFSVTAEGIETREMAEHLSNIGADYLQGFYFAKPMPMADFARQYGM